MANIAVQIYEIQDPWQAEAAIALGVDRIGSVILHEDHWRVPAIKEVVLVCKEAQIQHSLIPLFQSREVLFRTIGYYGPDIVHFCDALTDEDGRSVDYEPMLVLQRQVKKEFPGVGIMRSVPVAHGRSKEKLPTLEMAKCFETVSDCFLTDTWVERAPVQGYIGLTGCRCNWNTAGRLVKSSRIPVILAGGLSPDNVYAGIMATKPFGVDSCTRTNAEDKRGRAIRFKKDHAKIRAFVAEVRRAEEDLAASRVDEKGGT